MGMTADCGNSIWRLHCQRPTKPHLPSSGRCQIFWFTFLISSKEVQVVRRVVSEQRETTRTNVESIIVFYHNTMLLARSLESTSCRLETTNRKLPPLTRHKTSPLIMIKSKFLIRFSSPRLVRLPVHCYCSEFSSQTFRRRKTLERDR